MELVATVTRTLEGEQAVLREAVTAMDGWISRLPSDSEWRHAFATARRYLAADAGIGPVSPVRD